MQLTQDKMEVWLVMAGFDYENAQVVEVFASQETADSVRLKLLEPDEDGIGFDWAFVQRRVVES